jgi:hypothetical protein
VGALGRAHLFSTMTELSEWLNTTRQSASSTPSGISLFDVGSDCLKGPTSKTVRISADLTGAVDKGSALDWCPARFAIVPRENMVLGKAANTQGGAMSGGR